MKRKTSIILEDEDEQKQSLTRLDDQYLIQDGAGLIGTSINEEDLHEVVDIGITSSDIR